jgi:hypothetical protein
MARGDERRAMRTTAFACLTATAIVTPAGAQEWGFIQARPNDATLFYGFPDSDVGTLSVICNTVRKKLLIIVLVLPPRAKAGQRVRITLTAGASSSAYDGKVVRDRIHGGRYIEAPAPADTRIFDLLKLSQSLTIAVSSTRETVPLKNIADPIAKMEKACLGK